MPATKMSVLDECFRAMASSLKGPLVRSALWRERCHMDLSRGGVATMAYRMIERVIGRLLTDEDLRACFVERPRETLRELRAEGFELTEDEIDALARSDPQAWQAMAKRIHPRLQRCSLRSI
jgi:hypothetical protein